MITPCRIPHIDYQDCNPHNLAITRLGKGFWYAQLAAVQIGDLYECVLKSGMIMVQWILNS